MGFFGQIIEDESLQLPIPEDYELHLLQACVSPDTLKKGSKAGPIVLYAKTEVEEDDFVLAILDPSKGQYQCALTHVFAVEDAPVMFRVEGGTLHLTGKWTWDESAEGGCGHGSDEECENCEDDEEEEEDDEDDEEEAPELVELDEEAPVVVEKVNDKKKKATEKDAESEQQKKKVKIEEPVVDAPVNLLKKWKFNPDPEDDCVLVPTPKTIFKTGGLEITDFAIGNGPVPKPGAAVQLLYEGFFPNTGKLFDANLKRKKPFVFRKGTGQVIKGMDMGLEGMRIGGAREIVVPASLG